MQTGSNGFAFAQPQNGFRKCYSSHPHTTFYFRPEIQMSSEGLTFMEL
jgi:transposase